MSTTIDSKVVEMRFDNQQFESGVKTSLSTLDRLKQSLKMDDTKKGLQEVNTSMNNMKFDGISNGLETVRAKFSAFQVAGMAAIANLTNSVIDAGKKMANALISPIKEGGKQRAMNIAQAKFQFEGLGMDIEKAMEDANYAVADTAYGLDAAAKAASMFGATGIKVGDEMKMSLRAISGVAAQTSSEYEDIANIFTTIAGNGRLMGENLNSLASRGVNAAAILGQAMGKSEQDIRKMVSKGEIDFRTFAKIMDDTFGEHAKEANKTFSGAMSNIRAAMSKIGADIYTPFLDAMIGPLNSIRLMFNKVRKIITPFTTELGEQFHVLADIFDNTMAIINSDDFEFTGLSKVADKLTSFMKLGGLTNIIQGLANSFRALKTFMEPIKQSFRNFFPESTALGVVKLTKAFAELTRYLQPSEATLEKIRRIFDGLFAALDIGKMVLHALFTPLTFVLQEFGILGERVSDTAVSFADWVVAMRDAAKESQIFEKIANKITNVMKAFSLGFKVGLQYVKELIKTLGDKFNLSGFDAIGNAFSSLGDKLRDSTSIFEKAKNVITSVISAIGQALVGLPEGLKNIFGSFADYIAKMSNVVGSVVILDILRRMLLTFKKIKQEWGGFKELFKGIGQGVTTALGDLDSALIQLTNNLKSGILLKIAGSVLMLAVAMTALASIDSDKLEGALISVTALLAEMVGTLALLSKIKDISGSVRRATTTLTSISAAVLILAVALRTISKIPAEDLVNSLLSVISLVLSLTVVMFAMSKMGTRLVKGAAGLIAIADAVLVLSVAMKVLASIQGEALVNSLLTVVSLILSLTVVMFAMSKMEKSLVKGSAALLAMGGALLIISAAMKVIASIEPESLVNSLLTVISLMMALSIALTVMNASVAGAAAMLITAGALVILSGALKILASIKGGDLAKGLVAIGVALVELAIGCTAMIAALPGALALAVASAGLIALATAFKIMASIKWTSLIKDLLAVFGAMATMTAVGTAALVAVPGLLALSAAFLAVSASVVLFGIGISSIATGLLTLGTAVVLLGTTSPAMIQAFITSLHTLISGILTLLPNVAVSIGESLITIAEVVGKGAPIIADAFIKVVVAIADAIVTTSPKIVEAFVALFEALVKGVRQNASILVEEFVGLINDILHTFAKYVPEIIESGKAIMYALIDGISMIIPDLVDASFKAVIKFVNGLSDAIEDNMPVLEAAIKRLVDVIKSTLLGGLTGAGFISDVFESGKNAVQGFINGLGSNLKGIFNKAKELGQAAVSGLNSKDGLDEHSPSKKTYESGMNADQGLIDGIEDGLPEVEKMGALLGSSAYEGSADAAEAGGAKLQAAVGENNSNILSMFSGYLSKLSVLKQEESNILSQQPRKYSVGEEQAVLNTITNMRAKYNRQQEADAAKTQKNLEARQKTITNMQNKAAKQEGKTTATVGAIRQANVKSKAEEAKSIEKSQASIDDTISKSSGSTKKAADEKKKVYAEMTKEEKAYWENVLAMHKQGAEAEKYMDMDLLAFQESAVEEAGDLIDKYMEKYESTVDSLMAKGSIFDAVKEQDAVSKDELSKNLTDQINQLNEYAATVAALDQRLAGTNLQGAIQEMGIDSLAQLKALNSMTDGELQNYVNLYDTKYAAAQRAAIGQLGGLQRETEAKLSQMMGGVSVNLHSFIKDFDGTFASIKNYANKAVGYGADITAGLGKGISQNTKVAKDAAVSAVDDKTGLTKSIKDELGIHSPSRVMKDEVGAMIDKGIEQGIEDNDAPMRITARLMMIQLTNAIKEYVPQFYEVGVNIGQGLIEGLRSKENDLSVQASAMAKAALDSAKEKLKIHSPSRAFYEIGEYSGLGFVNALRDSGKTVGSAAANMAFTALEKATEILDSGVDINPTIAPVLDLSNIEEGSQRISQMTDGWNDVSVGVSGNLAANTANAFNMNRAASISQNQNGLDLLRSAINKLSGSDAGMTQNNTFNITGDNPQEIADEVSRRLQMQVERRGAVWA